MTRDARTIIATALANCGDDHNELRKAFGMADAPRPFDIDFELADAVLVALTKAELILVEKRPFEPDDDIDYTSASWHDGYLAGHAEAEDFNADGSYRVVGGDQP